MVHRVVAFVCLLCLAATGRVSAAARPEFTIGVLVQDYATVHPSRLRTAEQETARIFEQMGITIDWRERSAPADIVVGVPAFSVVILSPAMGAEKARRDRLADSTVATGARSTGRAYILYDRLLVPRARYELSEPMMLAHVLTHELGHLIADVGHSAFGVMRGHLELKEAGFFGFTQPQKDAIHAALAGAMRSLAPMVALRAAPAAR